MYRILFSLDNFLLFGILYNYKQAIAVTTRTTTDIKSADSSVLVLYRFLNLFDFFARNIPY